MNDELQSSTALSTIGTAETPQFLPKVWRVRLFAKEMMDCGFDPSKSDLIGYDPWNQVMKPLLLAKGVPEGFTLDRTPVRIKPFEESEHGPGIELEFE